VTALYLERKIAGLCPRCGDPSSDTSVLCEPHRQDAADRVAKHNNAKRAARRKAGQCAGCAVPSKTYWCSGCDAERKQLTEAA